MKLTFTDAEWRRLKMRGERLARLTALKAPTIVLVNETQLVMNVLGPRWLAALWRNIVTWNFALLRRQVAYDLLALVTWRTCENCGVRVWVPHMWDHMADHEPQEVRE